MVKFSSISSIKALSIGGAAALAILTTPASAAPLLYDQNITPDIIFGSGNTNGAFTVDQDNGIELGLRAKIPFVGTTHSNGDGTYSYSLAEANPKWNFDWTVNTDYNGATNNKISDFTYRLGIDFDPGLTTDFLEFDPITPNAAPLFVGFFDHSIGDNNTGNGAGTEAGDALTYQTLIDGNNVLQQSWRHAFFPIHPTRTYDPAVNGIYDVYLSAFDAQGQTLARTEIRVFIGVPEPAPFAVMGLGLLGLGFMRRRKA